MDAITTGGLRMPRLGLGTFRMQGAVCQSAVESALALGYRHIDTAQMYGNEEAVGAALRAAGVPRHEVHVTTKVWWENLAPDAMRRACDDSLRKLGLDHVDLYMIHWPARGMDMRASVETLMALREAGRTRAIGVCNFPLALLREAVETVGAPIAANQVEYHVLLGQTVLRDYMRGRGIALTAYCPLAQGRLAEHPALSAIARRHDASPAQVALAWLLEQDGVAAIPKSSRPEGQRANLGALAVRLDDEDRRVIAALPKDQRCVNPPFAPAWDKAA
ncbi:aldo/keto reductase [Acidisphaera rubrifaciens]|uniref:Aldo/keto reductase, 2,5-diketo-D-gluconate reductase n=1 Tax=Acidisphaera rubrifaciens HS-AP3 TaxID=1231350 RepID=A0A0D6P819_9PROT|nr:aldo/keto reductase [Acidisphaera rubrifaciens]GAN77348.1 aldo/keto reductase, 2,5-diketo-D-gluconate reductase [Acidisphaera rubrifaciens HS-AP3]